MLRVIRAEIAPRAVVKRVGQSGRGALASAEARNEAVTACYEASLRDNARHIDAEKGSLVHIQN